MVKSNNRHDDDKKRHVGESDIFVSDDQDDDSEDNTDDENGVDGTTTETGPESATPRGRDEVGEVRKLSSKDTHRLRLWRVVVTGVLLLTAFAVTFTTFTLLKQQEDDNFQTAVRIPLWLVIFHQSSLCYHSHV